MTHSIIAGATGLVGNSILSQLAARGDRPIALARRQIDDLPANAKMLEIDFKQFLINGELPYLSLIHI